MQERRKTGMRRVLLGVWWTLMALIPVGMVAVAAALWWWGQAVPLRIPHGETTVDVVIPPKTSGRGVARLLVTAGVDVPEWALYLALRASGHDVRIKAGTYEIKPGTLPESLINQLVRGEQALRSVTLIEGWTFVQVRKALQKAEHLKPNTQAMDQENIMILLGRPGWNPEGRFFPDTYTYPKHSADLDVLKLALHAMDAKLAQAWAQRQPGLPLASPEQALTLASLIEKETGQDKDRRSVAGVFVNRLRKGMRLQTDPSVIYGQGPDFVGRLRRVHLETDTPYNTYTRAGLPPTPIAMPGWAALQAAVQPASTSALYFVARGDGSSQFSDTLDEHNRAVRRYILKQP